MTGNSGHLGQSRTLQTRKTEEAGSISIWREINVHMVSVIVKQAEMTDNTQDISYKWLNSRATIRNCPTVYVAVYWIA